MNQFTGYALNNITTTSYKFESNKFESDKFESDNFEYDKFESDKFESDKFESDKFDRGLATSNCQFHLIIPHCSKYAKEKAHSVSLTFAMKFYFTFKVQLLYQAPFLVLFYQMLSP